MVLVPAQQGVGAIGLTGAGGLGLGKGYSGVHRNGQQGEGCSQAGGAAGAMGSMSTPPLLCSSLLLSLPPLPVPPEPCGVSWGLAPQGQGQDELQLCRAGMSKRP